MSCHRVTSTVHTVTSSCTRELLLLNILNLILKKWWVSLQFYTAMASLCRPFKERNVLFNNVLNTLYLWLYGIRYMAKDYSYSKKGNLLPPHGLLFLISSKGSFICIIPQTGLHTPWRLLHQSWSTDCNDK